MAWLIHIFTASGLIAGLMAIIAIGQNDWRTAMFWLLAALFVDGVDGTLARVFKVKEILPQINGKTIDTVVDFTNYAVVPAYFFYAAQLAGPALTLPLAFLILLVSAVYYGKEGMVSDDYYFVGFPVMWNVVIFYLVFVFPNRLQYPDHFSATDLLAAAVIIICSILHFVPIRFAYPSRATRMKIPTILATIVIMILMPLCVWFYPSVPGWLRMLAVANLSYFGALAIFDTFRK